MMALTSDIISHYRQPWLMDWSMRRDEKLDFNILIQGSYITDNELNSAFSSSFVSSTGVRVLSVEMVLTLEITCMNVI